jgi:hypothetical protein
VKTPFRFHIIKLTGRKEGGGALDGVKERIRSAVTSGAGETQRRLDELRAKTSVKVDEAVLAAAEVPGAAAPVRRGRPHPPAVGTVAGGAGMPSRTSGARRIATTSAPLAERATRPTAQRRPELAALVVLVAGTSCASRRVVPRPASRLGAR